MRAFRRSLGAVIRINALLLQAALLGIMAWLSWPSHPQWWGFGFISLISGVSALIAIIHAAREMTRLYLRERTIAEYEAGAKKQKNADLASDETLKQAGVIDG